MMVGTAQRAPLLALHGTYYNVRNKDPPWGLNGGKPGAVNEAVLLRRDGTEQKLLKATSVPMEPGDRLIFRTAGGGGWGDPRLRARHEVADDVAKGYVSGEAAQQDYGYDNAQESAAE